MKKNVLLGTMLLLAGSLLAADADKDAVKSAAKKLSDSGYSWKQSSANAGGNGGGGGGRGRGGFGGPSEGKAGKDGTLLLSFAGQNGNTRETIVKGEKSVTKNADGDWQTPEEAAAARAAAGNGGGGRRGGRGNPLANYKAPAALVGDLVDAAKDLTTSEGVVAGDFTEDGAKKYMMGGGGRGGRRGGANATPPEISGAKGSVKFWIKDGAISKVEYHVTGTISFNGNDNDVDRTTTIEFKEVGSTTVTIPEEAAKKLS